MPMEPAALNPTGGVTGKEAPSLDFRKDPTRPGGGVYVAQGARASDFKDLPAGTVINELDGAAATPSSATSTDRTDRNFTFSPSSFVPTLPSNNAGLSTQQMDYALGVPSNVNPAMNGAAVGGPSVQVLNTLEGSPSSLAEFQQADSFLDGLPGGMFDWGESIRGFFPSGAGTQRDAIDQWGTFFARLNNEDAGMGGVFQPPPAQAQPQLPNRIAPM